MGLYGSDLGVGSLEGVTTLEQVLRCARLLELDIANTTGREVRLQFTNAESHGDGRDVELHCEVFGSIFLLPSDEIPGERCTEMVSGVQDHVMREIGSPWPFVGGSTLEIRWDRSLRMPVWVAGDSEIRLGELVVVG